MLLMFILIAIGLYLVVSLNCFIWLKLITVGYCNPVYNWVLPIAGAVFWPVTLTMYIIYEGYLWCLKYIF